LISGRKSPKNLATILSDAQAFPNLLFAG